MATQKTEVIAATQHFEGLVLAAGKGSRFQAESGTPFPKVLRTVLGKPMVEYVLDALAEAGIENVTLIVGFMADKVRSAVGDCVRYVLQEEQKGSGHAVACAKDAYKDFTGHLIIMCGDSPLFHSQTVSEIMREHLSSNAAVTLASAVLDEPYGYGRILRNEKGIICGVVEEKCASDEQKAIGEVNGGAYAFDAQWLFSNIDSMALNEAGEYNLTDMVRVAVTQGKMVSAVRCGAQELLGVNTPEQLAFVEELIRGKD